jgi:hypothetical protein
MSTDLETETIALHVSTTSLDSFLTHSLLIDPSPGTALFRTLEHQQLFAIRLLDFLEPVKESFVGAKGSCLDLLHIACTQKHFDRSGSVDHLAAPVEALSSWLGETINVRINRTSAATRPSITSQD